MFQPTLGRVIMVRLNSSPHFPSCYFKSAVRATVVLSALCIIPSQPAFAVESVTYQPTIKITKKLKAESLELAGFVADMESSVWRTGNSAPAERSIRQYRARSGADDIAIVPTAGALEKLTDRAETLRETVTDAGFAVEGVATTETATLNYEATRTLISISVARSWVETNPTTGEVEDVGMVEEYALTLKPTDDPNTYRATRLNVTPEGSGSDDEDWSIYDQSESTRTARPRVRDQSSTLRPNQPVIPSDLRVEGNRAPARATASFDYDVFANYGKTWTASPYDGDTKEDFNPDYPYFDNNCSNFVSQMYNKAGWPRTGGVNPYLQSNWDDDLSGPAGATQTWYRSRDLYLYAHEEKGLNTLGNIWNAVPGNTYFMDWDGNGVINHVTAVTGRTEGGVPRISQKTKNRHNMLLTTWKVLVDESNPNVVWYGLRRTTD
jgi:hypothetical protein